MLDFKSLLLMPLMLDFKGYPSINMESLMLDFKGYHSIIHKPHGGQVIWSTILVKNSHLFKIVEF